MQKIRLCRAALGHLKCLSGVSGCGSMLLGLCWFFLPYWTIHWWEVETLKFIIWLNSKSNTLISTLNGTLVIGFLFCSVLAGRHAGSLSTCEHSRSYWSHASELSNLTFILNWYFLAITNCVAFQDVIFWGSLIYYNTGNGIIIAYHLETFLDFILKSNF